MDLNGSLTNMDIVNEEVIGLPKATTFDQQQYASSDQPAEFTSVVEYEQSTSPDMSQCNLEVAEEVVLSTGSNNPDPNYVIGFSGDNKRDENVDVVKNALQSAEIPTSVGGNDFTTEPIGGGGPEISLSSANAFTPVMNNSVTSKIVFKNNPSQQVRLLLNRASSPQVGIAPTPSIGLFSNQKSSNATTYIINPRVKSNTLSASSAINAQNFHLPVYSLGDVKTMEIGSHKKIIIKNNNIIGNQPGNIVVPAAPAPKIIRKKKEEDEIPHFLSVELKQGYRILRDLMSDKIKSLNWPFLDAVNSNWPEVADYKDVVRNPMWLRKSRFQKFYF